MSGGAYSEASKCDVLALDDEDQAIVSVDDIADIPLQVVCLWEEIEGEAAVLDDMRRRR